MKQPNPLGSGRFTVEKGYLKHICFYLVIGNAWLFAVVVKTNMGFGTEMLVNVITGKTEGIEAFSTVSYFT